MCIQFQEKGRGVAMCMGEFMEYGTSIYGFEICYSNFMVTKLSGTMIR